MLATSYAYNCYSAVNTELKRSTAMSTKEQFINFSDKKEKTEWKQQPDCDYDATVELIDMHRAIHV